MLPEWRPGRAGRPALPALRPGPDHQPDPGLDAAHPAAGPRLRRRVIEAFRVWLRDQVDLDTLSAELLAVTEATMQPTRASLWLRPGAGT